VATAASEDNNMATIKSPLLVLFLQALISLAIAQNPGECNLHFSVITADMRLSTSYS